MGLFRKVFKKAFGSKVGKKVDKFVSNPLRRIQRSHSFGKLGHTLLPSTSKNNLVTRGYFSLMNRLGKAANRMASRMAASPTVSNAMTASQLPSLQSQRLDYRYRRLKDLM